jgi:hypothetical protein
MRLSFPWSEKRGNFLFLYYNKESSFLKMKSFSETVGLRTTNANNLVNCEYEGRTCSL